MGEKDNVNKKIFCGYRDQFTVAFLQNLAEYYPYYRTNHAIEAGDRLHGKNEWKNIANANVKKRGYKKKEWRKH